MSLQLYDRNETFKGDAWEVFARLQELKVVLDLVFTGAVAVNLIPAGFVFPYAGASAPDGYLLCNGGAYSRTTYSLLFAAIGTAWGVGNGSTTFNIPDFRGIFLRGSGANGTLTKANAAAFDGGSLGDYVNDVLQGHLHEGGIRALNHQPFGVGTYAGAVNYASSVDFGPGANVSEAITDTTNGTPRTGAETAPASASVNYIIKY